MCKMDCKLEITKPTNSQQTSTKEQSKQTQILMQKTRQLHAKSWFHQKSNTTPLIK